MWFEELMGFREESAEQVRASIRVDGTRMRSLVNHREFDCGTLEILSLSELRTLAAESVAMAGMLRVSEVVGDVKTLHQSAQNEGALFQVASQFNLLEMVNPSQTPELGVGIYEHDHTQGPACAIAAGAGTIYRNYFVPVNGRIGQTTDNQIDCLHLVGTALGNDTSRLWTMRNGYALPSAAGLQEICQRILAMREPERDALRQKLRIGIQRQTQVTTVPQGHLVSQAYCSALPVAYSSHPAGQWAPFAMLVLEAAYEATMWAAVLNRSATGNSRVFLTLLGGGAFGNERDWIFAALERSLKLFAAFDLDVAIVSHGSSSPAVRKLITGYSADA